MTIPRRTAVLALLGLSVFQIAISAGSLLGDSATADEPAHIAAGWVKLVFGRLDFFREQPPLMNAISAAPLVILGYTFPPPPPDRDHWSVGHIYLFEQGFDSQRILTLARLPTLVLFAILPWLAFMFVRTETASETWGLGAFALVAFCPILMAHGRLATVDMAATVFCFLAAMLLLRLLRRPAFPTATLLGVTAAAAVLSKISSFLLGPFGIVVAGGALVARKTGSARRVVITIAVAVVVAFLAIEVFILLLASDAYVARTFPDIDTPIESLEVPVRALAANLAAIRDWYTGSNFALHFLLGDFSTRSRWTYYPVALFYKMTIPALLISIAGIITALATRRTTLGAVACLLFVALFLGASMRSDIALGVRYVLPILPFLYCAAMIHLANLAHRRVSIAAAVLIAWHAGETIAAYPRYIGWFNQFIGSHRNADRYLIDSNLDWGQDLRRLDRWCRENGVDAISVCYFGGGDVGTDVTVRSRRIWNVNDEVPPGFFALSRHLYRASAWRQVSPVSWREILNARRAQYVTTVGDSIDVYRID